MFIFHCQCQGIETPLSSLETKANISEVTMNKTERSNFDIQQNIRLIHVHEETF